MTEFDDIWAAMFKLRDAIMDAESKITAIENDRGAGVARIPPQPQGSLPSGAATETHRPGGGHFDPDDGLPLRFGDALENGPGLKFYAGPCYVCGRAAITKYKPRPGTEGRHRCWKCFQEARR